MTLGAQPPLDVLVDGEIFRMHARGGISRYFAELLREFADHPQWGIRAYTDSTVAVNEHLRAVDSRVREIPFPEMSLAWKVSKRLTPVAGWWVRRSLHPDLVHLTYYSKASLRRFREIPRVVTVHDMAPEILPAGNVDPNAHMAKRAHVAAADAVICVSEATRADLLRLWGPLPGRLVAVVEHGVGSEFTTAALPAPGRYVLVVGARDGYKNFDTLLAGFAHSGAAADGVQLLAAGGGVFTPEETRRIAELGVADSVSHLRPTDQELPGLYRGALVTAYPSRFEGFGMPVLEAMACGSPCLLADIPVLRERGGDAAMYADPADAGSWAESLRALLDDGELRRRLSEAGPRRVAATTWERTAERTAEVYRAVLPAVDWSVERVSEQDIWLTVVTVVRNDAAALSRTIDSVASQDCAGVEHLIVDGASTDGTTDIAFAAQARLAHVRVVSEPDSGVYNAMNRGIERARGTLVLFLNAGDDFAGPQEIEAMRGDWGATGYVWGRYRARFVDADRQATRPLASAALSPAAFLRGEQERYHQGAVMARSLLLALGGFDERYGIVGDFDLMRRAIRSGVRPWVSERIIADYDASGLSAQRWRQSLREEHEVRTSDGGSANAARSWAIYARRAARTAARRGVRNVAESVLGAGRVSRLRSRDDVSGRRSVPA